MTRVGLIGCGFMGRMHAAVLASIPDVELVAVCSHRPEAGAAQLAEKYGVPAIYDWKEMIARQDLDVIDICLPTDLHAEVAIAAMHAGKHVFCEKPMARTVAEADAMIAASRETGRRLMIGHCIRFWSEYAELVRLMRTKELGELLSLNLTRYGEFPHWSVDGWLGEETRAGGAALDMHIHDSDFSLYLLGKPEFTQSLGTLDGRGVSQIFTTAQFGRTVVHTEGGWNLPPGTPFQMSFRAVFEKGAAIYERGLLTIYCADGTSRTPQFVPRGQAVGGGNLSDLGGYYLEWDYFLRCLQDDQPFDECTPESARDSLAYTLDEIRQVEARA